LLVKIAYRRFGLRWDGTAPLLQHGLAQPLGIAFSRFRKLDYLVSEDPPFRDERGANCPLSDCPSICKKFFFLILRFPRLYLRFKRLCGVVDDSAFMSCHRFSSSMELPSPFFAFINARNSLHRFSPRQHPYFFDLRFFRPLEADLSIRKLSNLFPSLIAAFNHLGAAPRPAHVSPSGLRYFGATFLPFIALRPSRAIFPPIEATEPPSASNCFSSVARCETSAPSTFTRKSMSA
jgi:hypothetical protein